MKTCYWNKIQGKEHQYSATCKEVMHAWFGVMIDEIIYCPFCGGVINPNPLDLTHFATMEDDSDA